MRYLYCSAHTLVIIDQPTTCNIANHVICLVVRSRLFKLPQACKPLIVSLVLYFVHHYHTKMYYITINVQYVRYSTGRKIKYFIVIVLSLSTCRSRCCRCEHTRSCWRSRQGRCSCYKTKSEPYSLSLFPNYLAVVIILAFIASRIRVRKYYYLVSGSFRP